jgi:hypothetical protein
MSLGQHGADAPHEVDEVEAWTRAMVGQTLEGRYRLDAVIGIGAMGSVFRGHHLGLDRDMAVKLLHPQLTASPEMRERFSREASAASKLDHRNCVRVTDFGVTSDGHHFLVMDLLQGSELARRLGTPMAPPEALAVADQILAGLEHAHGRGLIHRDVKPENVFMTTDDQGQEVAKLVDFGIVKLQEGSSSKQLTQMGIVVGTPQYMSPEQAVGQRIDPRADLYAAGVILYVLLAGHAPFESDDPVAVLRKQIREPPPPLSDTIDASVRAFVKRLLEKDPDDRFANATEARAALRGLLAPARASEPGAAAPTPGPLRGLNLPPVLKRHGALIGIGTLVVLALVITVASRGGSTADASSDADASARADGSEPKTAQAAAPKGEAPPSAPAEVVNTAVEQAKALEVNLDVVDAFIESRKYDSAKIALESLLATYENEAQLHWRMGNVMTKLRGPDNRSVALQHYAAALIADASLLDEDAFEAELWSLLDDPKLREQAVDVAIDRLGPRAHDKLLAWLNTQAAPLPHAMRHRIMPHLEAGGRGKEINRPLQIALDLWQAGSTDAPCKAFTEGLEAAKADPDSFLVGTLKAVPVPKTNDTECPDAAEALEQVRQRHETLYAGLDPVVPKAFRKRPAPASSSNRKRRR